MVFTINHFITLNQWSKQNQHIVLTVSPFLKRWSRIEVCSEIFWVLSSFEIKLVCSSMVSPTLDPLDIFSTNWWIKYLRGRKAMTLLLRRYCKLVMLLSVGLSSSSFIYRDSVLCYVKFYNVLGSSTSS